VLKLHRLASLAMLAAVLAVLTPQALAQDASSDQAKARLQQAIRQYNEMDFAGAKASLVQVSTDDLSAEDRETYDQYAEKVDPALRRQRAALDQMEQGTAALKADDLEKARMCLAAAAESEFLPPAARRDAQADLALVDARIKAKAEARAVASAQTPSDDAVMVDDDTEVVITAEGTTAAPATGVTAPAEPATEAATEAAPADGDAETDRLLAAVEARQQRVNQLMEQGKACLDEGQNDQASAAFREVLRMDADNEEARRLLSYAAGQEGEVGETAILTRLEQRRRIARQGADQAYDKAMNEARQSLAAQNFEAALAATDRASNVLVTQRELYSATEYTQKMDATDALRARINRQQAAVEAATEEERLRAIEEAERKRRQQAQEERENTIRENLAQAEALERQQKYEEALDLYEEVAKLSPDERGLQLKIETLKNFVILREEKRLKNLHRNASQHQYLQIREAEIPWYQLINYPEDWREITKMRQGVEDSTGGEREIDRQVKMKLQEGVIDRLMFDEQVFEEVIQFLRDVSGLNINVKWTALEAIGVNRQTPVTVNLNNISYRKALDTILENVGGVMGSTLNYIIDDGVITISTRDDLALKTVTRVYDIRDLIVRVPNFEGPRLEMSEIGGNNNDSSDDDSTWGSDDDDDDDDNGEENIPTKSEIIEKIIELVTATIQPDSWVVGGGRMDVRELGGQLVITQTREAHQQIMELISQLREAKALQVSIEARFITIQSGFLNQIGLDLDFAFNLGSELALTRDPATGDVINDPETGLPLPTRRPSPFPSAGSGNSNWTPIGVRTNYQGGQVIGGSVTGGISAPAISIGGTFLDDVQVSFLLTATQMAGVTRTLTAPRITLFNGQRAYVTVATQTAYVSDLEPVVSANTDAVNPIISFVPTGSVLDVEATVSADRRYVTMTVRPQVSTLVQLLTFTTSEGDVQLPEVIISDLQTTVSVPDGGTLLLGGQRLSSEVEREMGVPLLNKVPIVNRFFQNRGFVREEETLLILIKPKIIIQREEEERAYPTMVPVTF
jgi:general secretion pathway protein D